MDQTTTYKIAWTRDPKRESAALLVALRGRVLLISVVVAVLIAVLLAVLHYLLLSLVVLVAAAAIPISARSRIRRSLTAGDSDVRVALSGRGVRPGKGDVVPWSHFTHWKRMPHDVVLLQQHGRRARAGLLIPLDAIKERDREGVFDLLDRHLTRS